MERAKLPYDVYRDRECLTLSGGEKRKAALAGVFALDAPLYLFDEPTAALDPVNRAEIARRILSLRDTGAAVAATTHSMEEAAAFDRVVVMKDGRVAAAGTPTELFYERYDPSWGLSLPWAVDVARRLTDLGIAVAGLPLNARSLAAALTGRIAAAEQPAAEPSAAEAAAGAVDRPSRAVSGAAPRGSFQSSGKGRRRGAGLEFFRNATIGQYLDVASPIRDAPVFAKYAGLMLLGILAFAGGSPLFPLLSLAASLALARAAKLPPAHLLRGYIPALPYLALTVLFQVAFSWPGETGAVLLSLRFFDVTEAELLRSALLCARLAAVMAALALFTAVTPLSQAIAGLSALLSPLRAIGVPVRDAAMVIGIVFRFVPVLVEEAERIAAGQLSRGGGYAGRGRVRAGLALTVPLFVRALERAESLALAMQLRGYRGDTRIDA
jgi:energy-coupling factor transporter transmembrane protein EcfT